jgi:DNA-binding NarL/FixJ family response regulator
MDALAEVLRHANTNAAIGEAVVDAARRHIGLSALSFMRISGPVISAEDFFVLNGRDEARARLSTDAVRVGSSIALRHSEALERLRAWVRAEARRYSPASPHMPPPWRAVVPGEQFVMRRFEMRAGQPLFLVGFAEEPPRRDGAHGQPPDTKSRAARLAREHGLTPRQAQVLAHLAAGKANKTIAAHLGCAENTVEFHVTGLLSKCACESRAELVARFWTS